jgi:hypothetical protein
MHGYGEEVYGSAPPHTILKKLEPTNNRGVKLVLGVFVIYRTENALWESGLPTCPNEKIEQHKDKLFGSSRT